MGWIENPMPAACSSGSMSLKGWDTFRMPQWIWLSMLRSYGHHLVLLYHHLVLLCRRRILLYHHLVLLCRRRILLYYRDFRCEGEPHSR